MGTYAWPMPGAHDYRTVNPPQAVDVSQWLTLLVGLAYLGAGLAGYVMTGFAGFADHDAGQSLLGFRVTPLHNLVHLVIGLAALSSWRDLQRTFAFGVGLAVAYGGTLLYGLFALGKDWDPLAINWADNGLHAASALAGGAIALAAVAADRRPGPPSFR